MVRGLDFICKGWLKDLDEPLPTDPCHSVTRHRVSYLFRSN